VNVAAQVQVFAVWCGVELSMKIPWGRYLHLSEWIGVAGFT